MTLDLRGPRAHYYAEGIWWAPMEWMARDVEASESGGRDDS